MSIRRTCPRPLVTFLLAVCLTLPTGAWQPARADEALLAVAANFADVIGELQPLFEKESGHTLKATIGSSGKIYAQIRNGAPFDVFLSADQERPALLEKEGGAVNGSRFTYAVGRLTLWSADAGLVGKDGEAALKSPEIRHVVIANPKLAPYGQAAREALETLGLWEELKDRIVMTENIGQAFAAVATGNAELGFVALSAVVSPANTLEGSRWDVPAGRYQPIRQDAVLLDHGKDNPAAPAFLQFLQSDAALEVIERYGYGVE